MGGGRPAERRRSNFGACAAFVQQEHVKSKTKNNDTVSSRSRVIEPTAEKA